MLELIRNFMRLRNRNIKLKKKSINYITKVWLSKKKSSLKLKMSNARVKFVRMKREKWKKKEIEEIWKESKKPTSSGYWNRNPSKNIRKLCDPLQELHKQNTRRLIKSSTCAMCTKTCCRINRNCIPSWKSQTTTLWGCKFSIYNPFRMILKFK